MGEWVSSALGDIVTLKRGYDLPSKEREEGPYPIVSSSGVSGCHNAAKVKGPGVVTGRYGTLGKVHFITTDYWPLNTTLYVQDFKGNDPRFIAYFLCSINFSAFSDKSSVPGVNRNHLHAASVFIPGEVSEQRAIADVLASLDDKIELNRRTNRALEGMARAIFKAWFIDFEPVKAKAGGAASFPGMPQDVFDQLPANLIDTELGPVPLGWRLGSLGEVMEHPRRSADPASIDPDTAYIGLEHMPRQSIALSDWGNAGSVTSNKHRFLRGEFLFGKLRPYFHKVGIAPVDGVCSTDVVVVRPLASEWSAFVLCHISSDAFVTYTSSASTGTKMPRTNWNDMSRFAVVLPPRELAEAFSAIVEINFQSLISAIHESRVLAALRDTLLPKLISGEVRVDTNGERNHGGQHDRHGHFASRLQGTTGNASRLPSNPRAGPGIGRGHAGSSRYGRLPLQEHHRDNLQDDPHSTLCV
ncbi:MAG: type I restriction enzyme, S subunit [Candidatus Kentron sp. G]|nr:MAG: type I restriction enzyme, S subunit [Candidatus Kentron sp. G]VFN03790.1 MAG: type I restriction enzyme, S subunit [Candidatus Kentron sp. G]VFN05089.1 MAG: type I restriction enzyme, S subunit [Candidatus Kentron sp. G]